MGVVFKFGMYIFISKNNMKKYFPIFLSKDGETTALRYLSAAEKQSTCPVLQIIPDSTDRIEKFVSTIWTFTGNLLFLDPFLMTDFDAGTKAELLKIIKAASKHGCNIGLCVRPGADPKYIAFVQSMVSVYEVEVLLFIPVELLQSVDSEAKKLLTALSLSENQCRILLDGNAIDKATYRGIAAIIRLSMSLVPNYNKWLNVIIASGSFPINLTAFTPPGRKYTIDRYEYDVWQAAIASPKFNRNTKYGDYGIKSPVYSEAPYAGTCSIKYTTDRHYIIYRGELSKPHPLGNDQYIAFAKLLVASPEYYGQTFSWGDEDIYNKSLLTVGGSGKGHHPGSAGTWVKISQNHHIAVLNSIL